MEQICYNVLVVDDSPINLRIIEKLLTGFNLKVTTAVSGREALDKITSMEHHLIFMDHLMPEMDGIETLQAIRRMEGDYYRKVPVIALTANEAGEAREWFLAEGFDEFLRKPLTIGALEPVLKKFFTTESIPEKEEAPVTSEDTKEMQENWEEIPVTAGLDVKTALLYCGGKESYLEILQYYCKAEESTEQKLEQAYAGRDWESYTIVVHGIKSAMQSIGASGLSEEARKLETAGRTGNTDYIPAHHEAFMANYKKLFSKLKESRLFGIKEEQRTQAEASGALKELSEDEFCRILDEMEDAAYDFMVEKLTERIAELKVCRYKGIPIAEAVESVQRKLEKSDYVSAVAAIKNCFFPYPGLK